MIISAFYGDNDIIKILLEFAADVDVTDDYVTDDFGFTPLIIAAQKGHLETVKLLVENGANLEIKNDQKLNALKMAVYKGNADIVEYLLENGAYENLFYQYREHRSNVGMSVQKRFALLTNGFVQRGIFVGLGEYYSFGGYSGLQTGFSEFVTIPEIGLYLQNSNLRMKISYKYSHFNNYNIDASRVNLSFMYIINKKIYYYEKEIYDL